MTPSSKISQALTQGLIAGYGGQTKFVKTTRGSFEVSSSHYENDDIVYHDEWTNGGGQEIIKVGDEMFTRVYAGGALGDSKEIIPKLIYFIKQLKDKTRLFSNCEMLDGDWKYSYRILDSDVQLQVTTAKETIKLNNKTIFVHCFVLSSIK